jgi:hypothetical protein
MESTIEHWVTSSPQDRKVFAQAVHIILAAIADDDYLRPRMIMKGGMLLGVRYQSSRFTEDIDFSTAEILQVFDRVKFKARLEESLLVASDNLPYQVRCVLQSFKVQPNEQATFPTLKLKIGYARRSDLALMRRLDAGQCPQTIKLDYSFNEGTYHPEPLLLSEGESIEAYGFIDLMAEKLRAVIQQVVRARERRQDIYDLNYLIERCDPILDHERFAILDTLHRKSEGRLDPKMLNPLTLRREDIKAASRAEYGDLHAEIEGPLPDFEESYAVVVQFYESLPWAAYQPQVVSDDTN